VRPDLELAAAGLHSPPTLEVGEVAATPEIPPRGDADMPVVARLDDDAVVADAVRGDDLVETGQIGPVDE